MKQELKKLEPFWGKWYIEKYVGSGACADVWLINDGKEKSVLKDITVIMDKVTLDNICYEGLDCKGAKFYLQSMYDEAFYEFLTMQELNNCKYTVTCYEYLNRFYETSDRIGWRLLLRIEKLQTMFQHFSEKRPELLDIIQLGINICSALEACQNHKILHRDIAPKNIFYDTATNYFKLGDFGMARKTDSAISMPEKVGTYAAPEVYSNNQYSFSSDLYSFGVILYRIINDYRLPFLPLYPKPYTIIQRSNALLQRYKGLKPPMPSLFYCCRHDISSGLYSLMENDVLYSLAYYDCANELVRIVMKTIEPNINDRYVTASQMRNELETLYCACLNCTK